MTPQLVREEVRAVMAFYEERGWDWRLVVEFTLWRWRHIK